MTRVSLTVPTPLVDLATWLAGSWTVDRVINDGAGTFRGEANFRPDGVGGLEWHEHGHLRFGAADGAASRRLRILPTAAEGWEVRFADGRAFHPLDLRDGACEVVHRCGEDVYRGSYVVLDERHLTVRWLVDGPRKADVIAGEYHRAGDRP